MSTSYVKVIIFGRLATDPDVKYTTSGICMSTFNIAVERNYKNKDGVKPVDYFKVRYFNKVAENVGNWLHKGMAVIVEGTLETLGYADSTGKRHKQTYVSATSFAMVRDATTTKEDAAAAKKEGAGAFDSMAATSESFEPEFGF